MMQRDKEQSLKTESVEKVVKRACVRMQNARQASRVKQVESPSSQRKVGCRFMNHARSRLASRPCRNCASLQHSKHKPRLASHHTTPPKAQSKKAPPTLEIILPGRFGVARISKQARARVKT